MTIEPLTWDSEFFGFPVGRIRLEGRVDAKRLQQCLEVSPFTAVHVMLRAPVDADVQAVSTVADAYGLRVEFARSVPESASSPADVVLFEGAMSDALLALAWRSGHESRFYHDPRFRPHFRRLYETWLEGSLSGRLADAVLVVERSGRLAGFVTVSGGDPGRIGLIAVHPDFQGSGVGSALLAGAHAWYQDRSISRATVVTQGHNQAACRLYEKAGYQRVSDIAEFHYWNDARDEGKI